MKKPTAKYSKGEIGDVRVVALRVDDLGGAADDLRDGHGLRFGGHAC